MGSKERRDRERQELRDKILDAARALFVEQGYAAVTMRALAQKIEYSPTAIYHHFKDKESLFRELCALDMTAMHTELERIASEVKDPVERIIRCAKEHVRFALEHRAQYQLLFLTPVPDGAHDAKDGEHELPEAYVIAYTSLRAHFVALVESGRARYPDPDLMAQVYFSGLVGIVACLLAMGSCPVAFWKSPDELAGTFAQGLVSGLLKPS